MVTPDLAQEIRWTVDEMEVLVGALAPGSEKTRLADKHAELRRALEHAHVIEGKSHGSRPRPPGHRV